VELLTESLLLSVVAGTAGLVVAHWTTAVATAAQPAQLASQVYTLIDWRVLAFAVGVSSITGLAFGAAPGLYVLRRRHGIRPGRPGTDREGASRLRGALVIAQIAMAIVLLTGSLSLGRAFTALLRVDNGYASGSIATMNVSLAGSGYDAPAAAREYFQQVLQGLTAIPGVRAASFTQALPLALHGHMANHFSLDGNGPATFATLAGVGPRYFETMGAQMLSGREFTERDVALPGESLIIINDILARRLEDRSRIIGRQLTAPRWPGGRIVGVVAAMRDSGPAYPPEAQAFYLSRSPSAAAIVARVDGRARDRIALIRDSVQSVDAAVPVFDVQTMDQHLERTLARPKFYATSVIFFGGLSLLLAVVGVYAVVSYGVVQRTREMGIRLAVGTTPGRLRRAVLRQTLLTVSLGALAGIAGSAALGRYLRSLVAGADGALAVTTALAIAGTALVAAGAIWSATRQISRMDVCQILRAESAD
jgi:predicted permease